MRGDDVQHVGQPGSSVAPSNTSTRRSSKPWWTFSSGLVAPALWVAEETVGIQTTGPAEAVPTASGFAATARAVQHDPAVHAVDDGVARSWWSPRAT